ncbi:hypothetical protein TNCV_3436801 [Trichonephila clavipes]|nr:hypothetical protein TNCV_3436801 [Trichonephila clavipes]
MDDTAQTKTQIECAAAGYMTTEKRSKTERGFQRHQLLYLTLKNTSHFCNKSSDWLQGAGNGFMMKLDLIAENQSLRTSLNKCGRRLVPQG